MMQPNEATKGISLHIGLNFVDPVHYQGWDGELNACEADAEDMKAIAESRGFVAQSLLTSNATRKNVIDSIVNASKGLVSGDIFFLSYSGHGGQLPDLNGDETDLEKLDETWCLYDAEFVDDELYKLFFQFQAGVRIIVLSDSCHSGTVTKERAIKEAAKDKTTKAGYRAMPNRDALKVYRANQSFYDSILKDDTLKDARNQVRASVLLISGCQDEQLSLDGVFNGLFTGMLLRVWQNGDFAGNYKEFHEEISKDMPKGEKPEEGQTPNYFTVGTENSAFEGQVPFTIAFP